MSTGKPMLALVARLHQVMPVLTVLATAVALLQVNQTAPILH